MTEVRPVISSLSSGDAVPLPSTSSSSSLSPSPSSPSPSLNSGLFATQSYQPGQVILDESPLFVLRPATPRQVEAVEAQFQFAPTDAAASDASASSGAAGGGGGNNNNNKKKKNRKKNNKGGGGGTVKFAQSLDTIAPPPGTIDADHFQLGKFRGMVVAAATYAALLTRSAVTDDDGGGGKGGANGGDNNASLRSRILSLYAPNPSSSSSAASSSTPPLSDEERSIVTTARAALQYCRTHCAPRSNLELLVNDDSHPERQEECLRVMLVWSCNAFEGGELYEMTSRINHSCDPNCVVREVEGGAAAAAAAAAGKSAGSAPASASAAAASASSSSSASAPTSAAATSTGGKSLDGGAPLPRRQQIIAAAPIQAGDEITISYLGILLYASKATRQNRLCKTKHFVCGCHRCCSSAAPDRAGAVPCPACHPRINGRYLDEDVQYDDDKCVAYAYPSLNDPQNGQGRGGGGVRCEKCDEVTKSAGITTLVNKVSDKVADRLLTSTEAGGGGEAGGAEGTATDAEHEVDEQLCQLSSSVLGARHWTTNLMLLSLLQRQLAALHSAALLGEGAPDPTELAECIDSLQRLWDFGNGLGLQSDMGHLLCGPTLGVARALVSLGDVKSKKYGAEWTSRVENYVRRFESDGMGKVVDALLGAWEREDEAGGSGGGKSAEEEDETMMMAEEEDGGEGGSHKRARMS